MNNANAARPVQSGDTFIAYIDDSICTVGVVIGEDKDERKWNTLVLGYFKEERYGPSENHVFDRPFPFTFPGYMPVLKDHVVPYDFKPEIALCKVRDSAWWKSVKGPCYTNLVARHFRPRRLQELQYLDLAQQILKGKDIDSFKSFGYTSDEDFLRLWTVLYIHFPERVRTPPRERDSENSNGYYTINLEARPPIVKWGLRPHEYQKDKGNLSRY